MITLRRAILLAIGLIMALAWAVMPPRLHPETGGPVRIQQTLQCPPGALLKGKRCVCAPGSSLKDGACVQR